MRDMFQLRRFAESLSATQNNYGKIDNRATRFVIAGGAKNCNPPEAGTPTRRTAQSSSSANGTYLNVEYSR
jgi:hypothetical protein